MAVLHKHVGETVTASYGAPQDAPAYVPPTRLKIVGTATFPAVGFSSFIADHTSMGTGALLSTGIEPPAFQRALRNPDPNYNGPAMVFVRLRSGVSAASGRANLQRIADAANKIFADDPNGGGNDVTVLNVQRPAQIVNYRSIGDAPLVLAGGLALGATIALALTLIASVRLRRRDLALLKSLGFTQRQLAAAVAWQATVAAVIGIGLGTPLGIVIGIASRGYRSPATSMQVPDPTSQSCRFCSLASARFVFANLVRLVFPGRHAAHAPVALLLELSDLQNANQQRRLFWTNRLVSRYTVTRSIITSGGWRPPTPSGDTPTGDAVLAGVSPTGRNTATH